MAFKLTLYVFILICTGISARSRRHLQWFPNVTPMIQPTIGEPWPRPQQMKTYATQFYLDPVTFRFNGSSASCDVLTQAFERYYLLIFESNSARGFGRKRRTVRGTPVLQGMAVKLEKPCQVFEQPSLEMNETYTLDVNSNYAQITATSQWAALRGLETFSQLVHDKNGILVINATSIVDWPRFPHRGVMLDTSLHYIGMPTLLKNLDAMEFNKFNVFHWHMVGDYSFPYQSESFPEMSNKGAFNPYTHIYSQLDIATVLAYARLRGIRVVPEFENPSHTLAWGKGQPGLLTPCYTHGKPDGTLGPIDPALNSTYDFMTRLFTELTRVFPDRYLAIGGSEIDFYCWQNDPEIRKFMKEKGFDDDFVKLEGYYYGRLFDVVSSLDRRVSVWEDSLDSGVKLHKEVIVQVWRGGDTDYPQRLANVTSQGYRTLLSSPWYLNYVQNPYSKQDWKTFYMVNPRNFTGSEKQKELVLGGEACLWTEYVDSTNVLSMLWPRASAVAERLWSAKDVHDVDEAIHRLTEHRCRMVGRGIPAQPATGPGYCKQEYMYT
ncbi:beta-hexosaminidase subunit alpha-like [Ptychodera flava]|uniref:beta-hexosaminidase subunit alpha-like n=1 Tax=Ptychodera flava TaxID=63121 RepID=UPI00396A2A0E